MSAKRDHTEPLVLYSLTVAEPSFKKSPVISLVKRPYATFAHDWNESNKQDIFKSQAERKLLESKMLALEKKDDVTAEEIAKLQTDLSNIPQSNFRRIAVDDVTPESLVGVEYIYQRRSQTAGRLVTVCRYDDTVQGDSVFLGIEIDLQCLPFLKGHRLLLGFISDRLHDQGVFSLGKILHIVMTGSVGGRTDRRTVEVDIDKREMLSCFLIEDMAYDISVGRIQGGMIVSLCPR